MMEQVSGGTGRWLSSWSGCVLNTGHPGWKRGRLFG